MTRQETDNPHRDNGEAEFLGLVCRYLDDQATADERARLNAQLRQDPARRETFVRLCFQAKLIAEVMPAGDSLLSDEKGDRSNLSAAPSGRAPTDGWSRQIGPVPFSAAEAPDAEQDAADGAAAGWSGPAAEQSPAESGPIIIVDSSPVEPRLFSMAPLVGGWLFSYAAATVIMGAAILGAWVHKVSDDDALAASPRHSAAPVHGDIVPTPELVGHITGRRDCTCSDPHPFAAGMPVALGRTCDLTSGLLEISYDSGAKVILQGPCRYQVDSPAGGFLSLGKLTARVDSGQWPVASEERSEVRGQGSEHYPLSTSHYPLFSVRTPTAVVTDLGTEFGVEVGKEGSTTSHVFRGSVRVRLAADAGQQSGKTEVVLRANQSARVERGRERRRGWRFAPQGAVAGHPVFVRRLAAPLQTLDLLDIVAGGNGTGQRRECGIDPTSGMEDPVFIAKVRDGDGRYRPVSYNRLIDGVFVPDGGPGPVQLDSAGHRFDGFPKTSGTVHSSIFARAAAVKLDDRKLDNPELKGLYWVYAMGPAREYMPDGRGLLALCPNAGITFDLESMRQLHRARGLPVSGR